MIRDCVELVGTRRQRRFHVVRVALGVVVLRDMLQASALFSTFVEPSRLGRQAMLWDPTPCSVRKYMCCVCLVARPHPF